MGEKACKFSNAGSCYLYRWGNTVTAMNKKTERYCWEPFILSRTSFSVVIIRVSLPTVCFFQRFILRSLLCGFAQSCLQCVLPQGGSVKAHMRV